MAEYTVTLSDEEEESLQHELGKRVGGVVIPAEATAAIEAGDAIPLPPPITPAEQIQSVVSRWIAHKAAVRRKRTIKSATPEELAELESIVAERLAEEAEDPD